MHRESDNGMCRYVFVVRPVCIDHGTKICGSRVLSACSHEEEQDEWLTIVSFMFLWVGVGVGACR